MPLRISVNFLFLANSSYSLHLNKLILDFSWTKMWSSTYCFEVTVHQMLAELCPIANFSKFLISGFSSYSLAVMPPKISVNFLFLANNSYSLHLIELKLDFLLDHGVEQCILFLSCSTPNNSKVMAL